MRMDSDRYQTHRAFTVKYSKFMDWTYIRTVGFFMVYAKFYWSCAKSSVDLYPPRWILWVSLGYVELSWRFPSPYETTGLDRTWHTFTNIIRLSQIWAENSHAGDAQLSQEFAHWQYDGLLSEHPFYYLLFHPSINTLKHLVHQLRYKINFDPIKVRFSFKKPWTQPATARPSTMGAVMCSDKP